MCTSVFLADEVAAIRRGEIATRPLEELTRELGFDPDELRAETRRIADA
ncbi:hypothetical protein [Leucobacter sp. W1038]